MPTESRTPLTWTCSDGCCYRSWLVSRMKTSAPAPASKCRDGVIGVFECSIIANVMIMDLSLSFSLLCLHVMASTSNLKPYQPIIYDPVGDAIDSTHYNKLHTDVDDGSFPSLEVINNTNIRYARVGKGIHGRVHLYIRILPNDRPGQPPRKIPVASRHLPERVHAVSAATVFRRSSLYIAMAELKAESGSPRVPQFRGLPTPPPPLIKFFRTTQEYGGR